MHSADGSTIFRPVVHDQVVATLLLIENSQAMMSIWPNLRDQHLPTLIGTIRIANPVAPIKILTLTSSPVDEQISAAKEPREYYELPDVQFQLHPDNKISIATIRRGIDLLASTGFGEPTARHIIIVAASTPAEEIMSSNIGDATVNDLSGSKWHFLARKLTQQDIRCHMILKPNQNMSAFTDLFYETLRLQFFERFQTNENYLFHLSARPFRHELGYGVGTQVSCTSRLEHAPLHHNYTFPSDVHPPISALDESSPTVVMSESPADVTAPSVVARLQQVHGLTKKKVYGTKPPRQPFYREDRVRAKYRRAPTPLAIPPSLIPPCHSASLSSYHTPLFPPGSNLPSGLGRPSNIINKRPVFPLSPVAMSSAVDDGDTPFIFDAEYEAASAARMEELLQSSPNLLDPIPSFRNKQYATVSLPILQQNNPYLPTVLPLLPASPTSVAPMEVAYRQHMLYAQSNQAIPETAPILHRSISKTYKGGSSSLTGWAG